MSLLDYFLVGLVSGAASLVCLVFLGAAVLLVCTLARVAHDLGESIR